MRDVTSTQFAIAQDVKDALDRIKVEQKDVIIAQYGLQKRFVTNTHVIMFLVDQWKKGKRKVR